jgi:hypothetical protein
MKKGLEGQTRARIEGEFMDNSTTLSPNSDFWLAVSENLQVMLFVMIFAHFMHAKWIHQSDKFIWKLSMNLLNKQLQDIVGERLLEFLQALPNITQTCKICTESFQVCVIICA